MKVFLKKVKKEVICRNIF